MKNEKQIEDLIYQMSRLADGVEELTATFDSAFNTGTFYDGKLIDGLMEISKSLNPERFQTKKK